MTLPLEWMRLVSWAAVDVARAELSVSTPAGKNLGYAHHGMDEGAWRCIQEYEMRVMEKERS